MNDRSTQLTIGTELDEENRVRLTVRDVGVGISADDRRKIFEAFYCAKSEGMGIGLSVSLSIVESHQGRIWAYPNEGPGATVALSLPTESSAGPARVRW